MKDRREMLYTVEFNHSLLDHWLEFTCSVAKLYTWQSFQIENIKTYHDQQFRMWSKQNKESIVTFTIFPIMAHVMLTLLT
jgi:uncharacterized protein YaeQ